jgi:prevent-host-death family protein
LPQAERRDKLVSVTRINPPPIVAEEPLSSHWPLQDAKARFSELVRLAHSAGPQHVTLHGRDAVVVVDAAEFQRLQGQRTGQLLIDALQASPHRDVGIAPARAPMPVRSVKL